MTMGDIAKFEDTVAVRFVLKVVLITFCFYLISNIAVVVILAVLVFSVIVHMNNLIKAGVFPPVFMLAILNGVLICMLIDVFYFGGIRHRMNFNDWFRLALSDIFVNTGLLMFFVVRKYEAKPVDDLSGEQVALR